MADKNKPILNNDSFDINELASLNDDISPDLLEQLQNQVTQNAGVFMEKHSDGALFEETTPPQPAGIEEKSEETPQPASKPKIVEESAPKISIDDSIDDNFIKKYKAKLNKQKNESITQNENKSSFSVEEKTKDIENLTSGNIVERPITQEQITYNDSLDYLDENIKYSKYVIYIDPENTDFIESLTVKERKNLINKILREQDDIAITKKRFNMIQSLIKHSIISIITIAISIPIIYAVVNASLEASINNYRNSQTIFKTLYREKGKIQATTKIH